MGSAAFVPPAGDTPLCSIPSLACSRGFHIQDLAKQLRDLVESKPSERAVIKMDAAEDPAMAPIYWVSKWIDYSDKYGLGYCLNDAR